jgi:DNA-binding transcriptional ArsR family regulator
MFVYRNDWSGTVVALAGIGRTNELRLGKRFCRRYFAMLRFEIVVGRVLRQRRNDEEIREHIDTLAHLPRTTHFRYESADITPTEERNLLWHYRAVIHYVQKKSADAERLARERDVIFERVRKACLHKRWGKFQWHIENDSVLNENVSESSTGKPLRPIVSVLQSSPRVTHDEPLQINEGQHSLDPRSELYSPDFDERGDSENVGSSPEEEQDDLNESLDDDEPDPEQSFYMKEPSPGHLNYFSDRSSQRELSEDQRIREATDRFKMVSDATRLKILLSLHKKERNVTELCSDLESQSQPAVSHHLALLRGARLVRKERRGKNNYYQLTDVGQALATLAAEEIFKTI